METTEAQKLGATDFILKPFKREELLASLSLALIQTVTGKRGFDTPSAEEDDENRDFDFCRLSIDEFVSGNVSLADIFVRLTEKKYIQVACLNSELSYNRIQAYKSKGLHFLYIRKEDFARYIGLNLELTKVVGSKNSVSRAQRLRLMKHTSEILLQDAYVNGLNRDKLQASVALVEAMVSTLSEDKDIFRLIELLKTHADYLYAHSLGVALYASMIAKEVGWAAPALFKITMGGLLHDLGKKEISRSILEKPRQNQGFPYRILKSKIHPLAKIISVASEFCDLILKSPSDTPPMDPKQALERLYSFKMQELEPAFLRALMVLFDFPIPVDMPKSNLPPLK